MKAVAPLAALTLGACTTVAPGIPGPTAALGGSVYVNGLRIRPIEVIEDSRCPKEVACVWAGRVVVRSEIRGGSWRQTLDLELNKPQQVADGSLTLVAVTPSKAADVEIDPQSYRLTFDFRGGI